MTNINNCFPRENEQNRLTEHHKSLQYQCGTAQRDMEQTPLTLVTEKTRG